MRVETRRKLGRIGIRICFVCYIVAIGYFLFFSERYGRGGIEEYSYNLTPFREIKRYLKYRHQLGSEYFTVNIIGNVLAFVPYGFFVPVVSPGNRSFLRVLLYSFEFSLLIELIQLSFQVGTFDVDDLLMNTFGGIVGFIVFKIVEKKIDRYL